MPRTDAPILVWFRDDLRIHDNPALVHAANSGRPVVAAYVLDVISDRPRPLGAASRWWLHGSLASLKASLQQLGSPLVLRRGPAADVIRDLAEEVGAAEAVWNRRYDPEAMAIDSEVERALRDRSIEVQTYSASLLVEPADIATKAGGPFRVFTPFWRAAVARGEPRAPLPAPDRLISCGGVGSEGLDEWHLEPRKPDWAGGLAERWQRGEAAAHKRLAEFVAHGLDDYDQGRDRPDRDGTTSLSPHLRFGEISPFQIWHAVSERHDHNAARLRSEIGWREFNHHVLRHSRCLHRKNVQPRFDNFEWNKDPAAFAAWTKGLTGYPIVDAGMRQLWQTGWMHNRVRMIVGSFLVKDLLIDWRHGESWFWDTLVDADPANNPGNWQWVAGCGADAAPFFRIFNPVRQGEKFDPNGAYVRQFVPELARLPDADIHEPWKADPETLSNAGVILGKSYPKPIVDHGAARDAALAAFRNLRNNEHSL